MSTTTTKKLAVTASDLRHRLTTLIACKPQPNNAKLGEWQTEFASVLESSYNFLLDCADAGMKVKTPSLVLSASSEWIQADGDAELVTPTNVNRDDPRVKSHEWHDATVITPPNSPTAATKDWIAKTKKRFPRLMLPPPPVSRILPRVLLQLPPPPAKAIEAEMSTAPTKADSKRPVPKPAATSRTKKRSARQDGFKSATTVDSSEEEAVPPKKRSKTEQNKYHKGADTQDEVDELEDSEEEPEARKLERKSKGKGKGKAVSESEPSKLGLIVWDPPCVRCKTKSDVCGRTLGASYKVCDECHRGKVGCTGGEEHGQPMPPVTKLPQRSAIDKSKQSGSDTAPLPSHSKLPTTTKAIIEVETVAAVDRRVKLETQIKTLVNAVQGLSARLDELGSVPATLADVKKSVDELIIRGQGPSGAEYDDGLEDFTAGGWGDGWDRKVDNDAAATEDSTEGKEVAGEADKKQLEMEGENAMEKGEADGAKQSAGSPMADVCEETMDAPADEDEQGNRDAEGEDEVQDHQEGQGEDAAGGDVV